MHLGRKFRGRAPAPIPAVSSLVSQPVDPDAPVDSNPSTTIIDEPAFYEMKDEEQQFKKTLILNNGVEDVGQLVHFINITRAQSKRGKGTC